MTPGTGTSAEVRGGRPAAGSGLAVTAGVGVFVMRGGTFLVGRREGRHGHGTWALPGGRLEFGESLEDAGRREVLEETGVVVTGLRVVGVTNDVFPDEDVHSLTVWLGGRYAGGEPTEREPDKFARLRWVTLAELPFPRYYPWQQFFRSGLSVPAISPGPNPA